MKSNDPIIIDGEEYRRLLSQIADRDIEIAARQARIGRVEHQHKAQLAARDKTIEELKAVIERLAYRNGIPKWLARQGVVNLSNEAVNRDLTADDSILGLHTDSPATAIHPFEQALNALALHAKDFGASEGEKG